MKYSQLKQLIKEEVQNVLKESTHLSMKNIRREILKEIIDSPYLLHSPSNHKQTNFDNYVDYEFTTDTGKDYYVRFSNKWVGRSKQQNQKHNWQTELTFFPKELKTTPETEEGDENFGKILATVVQALKKYTDTYKPEYVFWGGIKGHKEKTTGDSTKRHRIYNMVMDKVAKGITEYTPIKGNKSSGLIINTEVPVSGANKIFTYPEEPSSYDEDEAKAKTSRFNLQRQ
jgi:hypothetical protein